MNQIKNINRIFGYIFIALGISKFFIAIMAILYMYTTASSILTGNTSSINVLQGFSQVVSIIELILFVCSVILLIINIKVEPSATLGYGIVLVIALAEIIIPSFFLIVLVFALAGAYVKAGRLLLTYGGEPVLTGKNTKKEIEDTDWFYSNK